MLNLTQNIQMTFKSHDSKLTDVKNLTQKL